MTAETLQQMRDWLSSYVDGFREEDGSMNYLQELKIEHSFRVAEDCKYIASGLKWSDEDVILAEAVGLMHDVGRFSQFKEYGTFHDPDSVNHGKRGFEVAQTCEILEGISEEERTTILDSIHFHNCRFIPEGLPDDSVRFLKLIRDADKIDIIYIFEHTMKNNLHEKYPQIMLDIDLKGPVTQALLDEVRETGTGSYRHVNSMADLNLMRLTWITNINYDPSYRIISDRNLMEALVDSIPSNPEVDAVISRFMGHLEDRLSELNADLD